MNQSELAAALGVTKQAISLWIKRGYVPTSRALQVHEVTGIPLKVLLKSRSNHRSGS